MIIVRSVALNQTVTQDETLSLSEYMQLCPERLGEEGTFTLDWMD